MNNWIDTVVKHVKGGRADLLFKMGFSNISLDNYGYGTLVIWRELLGMSDEEVFRFFGDDPRPCTSVPCYVFQYESITINILSHKKLERTNLEVKNAA